MRTTIAHEQMKRRSRDQQIRAYNINFEVITYKLAFRLATTKALLVKVTLMEFHRIMVIVLAFLKGWSPPGIDSIEVAATGVTYNEVTREVTRQVTEVFPKRSPGHGGLIFLKRSQGHRGFSKSGHKPEVTEVFPKRSQDHGGFSKAVTAYGREQKGNHGDIVLRLRKLQAKNMFLSRIPPSTSAGGRYWMSYPNHLVVDVQSPVTHHRCNFRGVASLIITYDVTIMADPPECMTRTTFTNNRGLNVHAQLKRLDTVR